MHDETCHDQRDSRPVWDAERAQVVQTEGERVEKQPSHWLRMILKFGWGYGEGVGLCPVACRDGDYVTNKRPVAKCRPTSVKLLFTCKNFGVHAWEFAKGLDSGKLDVKHYCALLDWAA